MSPIHCKNASCTISFEDPKNKWEKARYLCKKHKRELTKAIAAMYYDWHQVEREVEGATPAEGLEEARFGWMRGARRNSV